MDQKHLEKKAQEYKNILENMNPDDLDLFFENIIDIEYILEGEQYVGAKIYIDCCPSYVFFLDTALSRIGLARVDGIVKQPIDRKVCAMFNQYARGLYEFEQNRENAV